MIADPAMGRMGYPLINVAHRLILHKIQGIYQKNQHEQVGTLKRAAQLSLARRGQRQRWTGHRTCRRKSNLGNTSMNKKKRGYEETHSRVMEKKANRDSPAFRRRWTSWSKFRATGWSHGSVLAKSLSCSWVQRRNRARRQSRLIGRCHRIFSKSNNIAIGTEYNTNDCSELTILTSTTEQSGMNPHLMRVGFYRRLERTWLVERHHVGILNTRGDSRGCPPWVHVFVLDPKSWHEEGIGGNKRINKGMSRGDVSCLILTVSGWTAEGWSIPRTSHLVECCPWKSK